MKPRRATGRPVVRFFAIGALCFASEQALRPDPVFEAPLCARERAACDDDDLLAEAARRLGVHQRDPVVRRRLIANLRALGASPDLSDRALFAEALALGMQETDPVARRRLAGVMRRRIAAGVREHECARDGDVSLSSPTAGVTSIAGATPDRVRLEQRFFDAAARGDRAKGDARGALDALRTTSERDRSSLPAHDATESVRVRGDPHLADLSDSAFSLQALARWFGEPIARAIFEAPVGRWIGPLPSAAGWHLFRVRAREFDPGGAPSAHDELRRRRDACVEARVRAVIAVLRAQIERRP